jgi:hypothetical protein
MFLAPERDRYPVTRACPLLADQRGCGRTVLSGGRRWTGWCGRRGVADSGGSKETGYHLHVSIFSLVIALCVVKFMFDIKLLFLCSAGAAVGAAATANAGGIVAAGGAALSAGAGAVASAASALFSPSPALVMGPLPARRQGFRARITVLERVLNAR